jgi:hypothetical protein
MNITSCLEDLIAFILDSSCLRYENKGIGNLNQNGGKKDF